MDKIHITGGPMQSEFEEDPNCYVVFATNGLQMGRIIASSKGEYCKEHQGDLVIFNANIITQSHGKVWYGDLNITHDFDNLKNVADQLGENLYILMEGDARFGLEKQPVEILMSKARTVIKCNEKMKEKMKDNSSKLNTNSKKKKTK